jgi:integrase
MKLSNIAIKNAKPKDKSYKMSDGDGMSLLVMPNGSKLWRFKYYFNRKEKGFSLGPYPEISLARAREKRLEARRLIAEGIDPGVVKQEKKRDQLIDAVNTFEEIARQWHEKKKKSWSPKYAATILNRLEMDIFPSIGRYPIKDITPGIMLRALQEIEQRGVYELTRRAKQYCGQIFRYAIPLGLADRDMTADLKDSLESKATTKHIASIDPEELPQLVRDMHRNDARMYIVTKLAMEMMLHTFVRTNELIKARWDEFHFETARWVIPAERMKMKKAHIVPLSSQVIEILEELKKHTGHYPWVFASPTRPRDHMSDNAILKALERMGYKGRMTGHGFRSLAMTTILEKLNYAFDVVDAQLAHAKRNSLGEAYDRAKYLTQRTQMMQDWSDYLSRLTNHR